MCSVRSVTEIGFYADVYRVDCPTCEWVSAKLHWQAFPGPKGVSTASGSIINPGAFAQGASPGDGDNDDGGGEVKAEGEGRAPTPLSRSSPPPPPPPASGEERPFQYGQAEIPAVKGKSTVTFNVSLVQPSASGAGVTM